MAIWPSSWYIPFNFKQQFQIIFLCILRNKGTSHILEFPLYTLGDTDKNSCMQIHFAFEKMLEHFLTMMFFIAVSFHFVTNLNKHILNEFDWLIIKLLFQLPFKQQI